MINPEKLIKTAKVITFINVVVTLVNLYIIFNN